MFDSIYISGKITGCDNYHEQFEKAETYFKILGYKNVINPVKIDHGNNKDWHQYMITDLKVLLESKPQCMYMLKNWRDSKGARIEHAIALETGMHIFYEH